MKDEPTNRIPPLSQMTSEWLSALSESTDHHERLIGFLTLALIESKLARDYDTAETLINALVRLPNLPGASHDSLRMHQEDIESARQNAPRV